MQSLLLLNHPSPAMADGAEIITLDSDDEADSSDTMSNQQRMSGGGMLFNPANYADLMSQVSQSKFMAPFTKVMQSHQKQVKPKGPKKFPKRPGVFPPFALFTQEHRENLMLENKELSFADFCFFLIPRMTTLMSRHGNCCKFIYCKPQVGLINIFYNKIFKYGYKQRYALFYGEFENERKKDKTFLTFLSGDLTSDFQ